MKLLREEMTQVAIFAVVVLMIASCAVQEETTYNKQPVQNGQVNQQPDANSVNQVNQQSDENSVSNRHELLWKESKISSYRMTIRVVETGFYVPPFDPFVIEVRQGKAVSMKPTTKGGDSGETYKLLEMYDTVEKLFDIVKRAQKDADVFEVEYDPKLGYPKEIFIDWRIGMTDTEVAIKVLKLEVIE
ncbi:MAG: DUF6174 domain-containing protein [Candidatus Woesearchaeota archaeon]|jgi:hypothetical protein